MIKTLTFSTLFPNSVMPRHGIFVENRLRHLLATKEVETQVVAPVPWFPFTNERFGAYSGFARVPMHESRHGVEVEHPRYPLIPKIGMSGSPWLMAKAMRGLFAKMIERGPAFDLIDAHYFYPDGVAAVILGGWFQKPVVITARGTDVNLIPAHYLPRRWIKWAARRCAGIITVSEALRTRLTELGVEPEKIRTLRNGVDLTLFHCLDSRDALREAMGIKRRTLLSVGHLIERKGHHIIIDAMPDLADIELMIAGDGEWQSKLIQQAKSLGVADRVRFLGALTQPELVKYYNAADALVLASSREGMANVLLESLACGTPLVATPIWGTPEVIADRRAGVLMRERSAAAVADAVTKLFADYPARAEVRNYAENFDWAPTTAGQLSVFRRALGQQS